MVGRFHRLCTRAWCRGTDSYGFDTDTPAALGSVIGVSASDNAVRVHVRYDTFRWRAVARLGRRGIGGRRLVVERLGVAGKGKH
jgi:hypothetical protein